VQSLVTLILLLHLIFSSLCCKEAG